MLLSDYDETKCVLVVDNYSLLSKKLQISDVRVRPVLQVLFDGGQFRFFPFTSQTSAYTMGAVFQLFLHYPSHQTQNYWHVSQIWIKT